MNNVDPNLLHTAVVMQQHIRNFFAMRKAYTRAGLRMLFDELLHNLDPEKTAQVDEVQGNLGFDVANEEIIVEPSSTLEQNVGQLGSYIYTGPVSPPATMPECLLQVPIEEIVTNNGNDKEANNSLLTSVSATDDADDKEELEVVEEIPHRKSSLSKIIKGKMSEAVPPIGKTAILVTQNLLGLRKDIPGGEGKETSPPTTKQIQREIRSPKPKRSSPYSKLQKTTPEKIRHVPGLKLFEKQILQKAPDGIYYDINKILEHFGKGEKQLESVMATKYKGTTSLNNEEREFVARCAVQCLRAVHGYDRVNEGLDQICRYLAQFFPTSPMERWKILCNSVPN